MGDYVIVHVNNVRVNVVSSRRSFENELLFKRIRKILFNIYIYIYNLIRLMGTNRQNPERMDSF